MLTMSSGPVEIVLRQHAEGAVHLAHQRTAIVRGAGVGLGELRRHDRRLEAYLDGLATAGEQGTRVRDRLLESPGYGEVFVATIGAIHESGTDRLDRLFAVSRAMPLVRDGMADAFGWVAAERLVGLVKELLGSSDASRRRVGIAACAMHRVHSPALLRLALDTEMAVRADALRSAGELGRQELLSICTDCIAHDDPECQLWGTWSAVMLGNRGQALEALAEAGLTPGPHRAIAFHLGLQAMTVSAAHCVLQRLVVDPQELPWLIQGSGVVGDPAYVPWLIGHMARPETARAAGESFCVVTGVDLAREELDRDAPVDFETGPNDDAADPNVAMDADDGLPWPDREKVEQWWAKHGGRFEKGERYFMGAPVTRPHCVNVLKNGYQRQRILAAHYLCLLDPGTPLFNTSAPAWRQQKLLSEMS